MFQIVSRVVAAFNFGVAISVVPYDAMTLRG